MHGGLFPSVIYLLFNLFLFFLNCGFNGLPMETILFLFSVSSDINNTTDNDRCTITSPAQLINHKTVANFYLLSVVVGQFCLYYSTFKWHKERRLLTLKPLLLMSVAMRYANLLLCESGEMGGARALISSMHTALVALSCRSASQQENSRGASH